MWQQNHIRSVIQKYHEYVEEIWTAVRKIRNIRIQTRGWRYGAMKTVDGSILTKGKKSEAARSRVRYMTKPEATLRLRRPRFGCLTDSE